MNACLRMLVAGRCWRCWPRAARGARDEHGRDGAARDRARRVPVAVDGERQPPGGRGADAGVARRAAAPRRTSLRCGEAGLQGTLAIDGVGKRYSAAMVKVFWLDGQSRVYTLTAGQPTVHLYGSADDRRGMGEIACAYTVLGVEHILSGVRPPAVRARACCSWSASTGAWCWTITAFTRRAQPDAGAERARLADAARAAGRGDDRAVDRAGRRRGAAQARRRCRAAGRRWWRSCSAWCTASASPARSRRSACRRTTCRWRC